ncbi:SAG-related sequence [Besnoitia besnoiti]|uniref:SAG-related sequence n=1 Tax=Besnoitia besnoiti TaxID=94643 RepID=A0A2A9MM15_BESBE|nr:SAG-related sequence [Besnoitia besnoiti]PFH36803.1 SAG-related sequence [Besnoitia besnoiti]
MTIALFFVGIARIHENPPVPVLGVLAAEQISDCVVEGARTKCTCEKQPTTAPDLKATISEETNELEIYCKGGLNYAPEGLLGSKVCSADADDVTTCKAKESKPGCINVNALLVAASTPVEWQPSTSITDQDKSKVLNIPKDKIPYVDEEFHVGCSENNSTTKCKVAVTITARTTKTKDRTVTCAYGHDSNKKHQMITLSPSQNTFTLVCGAKGEIVQKSYKSAYCGVSEKDTPVRDCPGKYTDILPGYEERWWTDGKEKSFTFTIPEDKFPTARAKMMVQCQKEEVKTREPATPQAEATFKPSVCSVDVTIESAGSASLAPPSFILGLSTIMLLAGSGLMVVSSDFLRQ